MFDFTKAKRIEWSYIINKGKTEKRPIYIFDCSNCDRELRLHGKTGIKKSKGYCRYCSPQFIERKPKTEIICPECDKTFLIRNSRIERTEDAICCSMKCRQNRIKNDPSKHSSFKYQKDIDRFLSLKLNRLKSSAKRRGKEFSISREYLINLYHQQEGKCYYTNLELKTEPGLFLLSVDRTDNKKGYVEGNVVFCCNLINNLKHQFEEEEIKYFLKLIVENANKN